MSWSTSIIGRAGVLAPRIADDFKKIGGAPAGSAEEDAKNRLGDIAAALCAGFNDPSVAVKIEASGSAWTDQTGKHKSVDTRFTFSTVGNFIEA